MNDVYCIECKHIEDWWVREFLNKEPEVKGFCRKTKYIDKTSIYPFIKYKLCSEKNKNNDCKNFEKICKIKHFLRKLSTRGSGNGPAGF